MEWLMLKRTPSEPRVGIADRHCCERLAEQTPLWLHAEDCSAKNDRSKKCSVEQEAFVSHKVLAWRSLPKKARAHTHTLLWRWHAELHSADGTLKSLANANPTHNRTRKTKRNDGKRQNNGMEKKSMDTHTPTATTRANHTSSRHAENGEAEKIREKINVAIITRLVDYGAGDECRRSAGKNQSS